MTDYDRFLASKTLLMPSCGIEVADGDLPESLFDFQRAMVRWALRKGRAALFATTGMGKTAMQLAWGQAIAPRCLILSPLAVAEQTVREGQRMGIPVTYARKQAQSPPTGITITNYEMLDHFDPGAFPAVVLDESSCLKHYTSVLKKDLIRSFRETPFRLCCTATPAPNDTVELCNHADFLGLMKPADMLSTFFITVGGKKSDQREGKFRLKSHARAAFFEWLASWAMSLIRPSDLGFADDGYDLPPLSIHRVEVASDYVPEGQLFHTELKGVTDRARVRRGTLEDRVAAAAELVRREPGEQWLLWTWLNEESEALARALPGAVEVKGSDSPDSKARALLEFAAGRCRVLITKASIAGFGLNFQSCARMAFVGLSDSYEMYFQAIRRCYRFGQARTVHVYIVLSEVERAIYDNVLRKEQQADEMSRELIAAVRQYEEQEIRQIRQDQDLYRGREPMALPAWLKGEAA